ncbi:MAG: xylulose kinase [Spirochaetia bacterium]|nr:xylulose kinase [Spirochaetia bacterium]
METFIIGLDIGTTGAKSMILSLTGTPVSSAYREYPCTYPRPNWVEQDVDLVVKSSFEAIQEAISLSGLDPKQIAAVSVSAQRSCGIFLDAQEKTLRPMISWQDSRSTEEAGIIAEMIDPHEYYRMTGFPNSATWLLSKMMWVRTHEPQVWEKTRRVVQMHDYFLRALGVEDYIIDRNDAGFFGLFDSHLGRWDSKLLDLFDIEERLLPIPAASGTAVGTVSARASLSCGLAQGTVIAVGAGDQSAGGIGAGVVREGTMSISMGTAGALVAYLDRPFRDPHARIMVTDHPKVGSYLLEGYQAAAAGVYRWFRDEIAALEARDAATAGVDYYALMNEKIEAVPAGSKGLLFLPYFAGAATPRYTSEARGTLIGLTFAHDKFCMARACMEGISMDMKDMIGSLEASGFTMNNIRILGGPTRSEVWNQIQSDIYGLPVATLTVSDAPLVGAAILAGYGAGIFSSIEEGSDALVSIHTCYEPDEAAHEQYRQMYELYQQAFKALDAGAVFSGLATFQHDHVH